VLLDGPYRRNAADRGTTGSPALTVGKFGNRPKAEVVDGYPHLQRYSINGVSNEEESLPA
jgi:hypothetical protein